MEMGQTLAAVQLNISPPMIVLYYGHVFDAVEASLHSIASHDDKLLKAMPKCLLSDLTSNECVCVCLTQTSNTVVELREFLAMKLDDDANQSTVPSAI